jgi:hypothetical protein
MLFTFSPFSFSSSFVVTSISIESSDEKKVKFKRNKIKFNKTCHHDRRDDLATRNRPKRIFVHLFYLLSLLSSLTIRNLGCLIKSNYSSTNCSSPKVDNLKIIAKINFPNKQNFSFINHRLPWNVDDAASRSADCDVEIATRQVLEKGEEKV